MNKKITTYKKTLIVLIVLATIYAIAKPAKGNNVTVVTGKGTVTESYDFTSVQRGIIYFLVFLLVLSFMI